MRLQRFAVLCAAVLLAPFAFGRPLHAQQIQCVTPAEPANSADRCTLRVPTDAVVTRTIKVQVLGPRSGQSVDFSLTPATNGSVTPRVAIGPDGTATATWTGRLGDQPTVIVAENSEGGRREIAVKPEVTVTSRTLDVLNPSHPPHWFVQRQLKDSVRVVVNNPNEPCSSNVVVFIPSPGDGSVSPDSVQPTKEGNTCIATTWWTLGPNIGRQHLRALLADERSKTDNVTAVGRALPRLGAGLMVGYDFRSYQTLKDTTVVIRITNTFGDTLTVARDTLVTKKDTSTVENQWRFDPVVITDFPILPSWRRIRGMVGVSAKSPERDFYLGLSVLQPVFGQTREGVAFDMQFVMHIGRREILRDPSCTSGTLDNCETREKFFLPMGVGVTGFFDGSAIISTITSIFK